jgi:hypothetical protein
MNREFESLERTAEDNGIRYEISMQPRGDHTFHRRRPSSVERRMKASSSEDRKLTLLLDHCVRIASHVTPQSLDTQAGPDSSVVLPAKLFLASLESVASYWASHQVIDPKQFSYRLQKFGNLEPYLTEHLPRSTSRGNVLSIKSLLLTNRCPKGTNQDGLEIWAGKEYSFAAAKLQLWYINTLEFCKGVEGKWIEICEAKKWQREQLNRESPQKKKGVATWFKSLIQESKPQKTHFRSLQLFDTICEELQD